MLKQEQRQKVKIFMVTSVDKKPPGVTLDTLVIESLARLDGVALGTSIGILFALAIFLATNILILKGSEIVGPNLGLLSQYFVGYEVSFRGSFVGLIYGLVSGFLLGWSIAVLRNTIIRIYIFLIRLKGSFSAVNDYIDNP